jgi:hypothetical protein
VQDYHTNEIDEINLRKSLKISEKTIKPVNRFKKIIRNYLNTYYAGVPLTILAFIDLAYIPLIYK